MLFSVQSTRPLPAQISQSPLLPAHRVHVSQGLDVVIVGKAVGARPAGGRVVALHGRLDQVLLQRDGEVRRGHALVGAIPPKWGGHLQWRRGLGLEQALGVLLNHRDRARGDGGAGVGREGKGRVRQGRRAGLGGGGVEGAVVRGLGHWALVHVGSGALLLQRQVHAIPHQGAVAGQVRVHAGGHERPNGHGLRLRRGSQERTGVHGHAARDRRGIGDHGSLRLGGAPLRLGLRLELTVDDC